MAALPFRLLMRTTRNLRRRMSIIAVGMSWTGVLMAAPVHTSWLWHLHQPVYWPDRREGVQDHYEAAWDTIQKQDSGRPHPSPEVLRNIFGLDDRVAAYQTRPRDTIGSLLTYPDAGAQVSYSGALMENVQSLGAAGQLGYGAKWCEPNQQASSWQTSGGRPRLDLVNFNYHHSLAPLLSDETLEMELRIHKRQMEIYWGTNPTLSRGYFPAETCFTERMIPILKKVEIEWSVVANNHLARACADFPLVLGSGGENCDIPNRADQLNPPQGSANYKRIAIERGCSPTAAMPFGFQSHYVRYIDPSTGQESKIIVVPADQALGWRDSYSSWDVGLLDDLSARNDPSKPAMALFAHDGDNAWSGGYSYYAEWTQTFAQNAAAKGFRPSTVEEWLSDYPPDPADVVHVEDGGWMYADGDFGSPIFVNWHWPPGYIGSGGRYVVDPSTGTSDKADNWRVIIATENRVKTAQQIAGTAPRIDQVRDPGSFGTSPNPVELAWHYYLAGLDSGFVYYGCHDDECQRSVVAQSNAVRNVSSILSGAPMADATPPTLFPPQRHPWNPGGTNFGVQYGYRVTVATNTDFWVWTYAHDVSGIGSVTLRFRSDGTNSPVVASGSQTYAGGPETGPWSSLPMTRRQVAPVIGVTPQFIADYYYAKVTGPTNAYVDYYVSATDARGNTYNSPIQHVYISDPQPQGTTTNDCGGRVCLYPVNPTNNLPVSIYYYDSGGPIAGSANVFVHLGWNGWATVVSPDPQMTFNPASNRWEYSTTVPTGTTQLDCVFNNGSVWDNNAGQDWHFATTASSTGVVLDYVMDGAADSAGYLIESSGMTLYAALRGTKLYVATASPGTSGPNDHFIFVTDALLSSSSAPAPWGKSGTISVATTKPFIGTESLNNYVAWHNAPSGSACAKSPTTSGQLEGSIDLASAFATVPEVIYLCAAAYQTADGGALVSQAPAGTGLQIEPAEFLAIPTAALADSNSDGVLDRVDPAIWFKIVGAQRSGSQLTLRWSAMPRRSYQVLAAPAPDQPFLGLSGSTLTSGPLQLELNWTNPAPVNAQSFYRIKLLP